ncbi:MAG: ribonuclease H-like domain-containing protein [Tissierella sp.]|nr:ribonuclease H-like domain-containing protein [Tissierella sp.]
MKLIEQNIVRDVNIHESLVDNKICFLDIETTGVNRNKDSIYLIGIVYFDDSIKSWKIIQLFADELKEEVDILLGAYNIISKFDVIVNYNGESFDIPFINSKLSFYKTNLSIDINKSLDLFRIIKANRNILDLDNLKLESVEQYLGIYRQDKFTGRECIDIYFDYLITKNIESKDHVLLHNYEDLYYLLDVIKIIDMLEDIKCFHIEYNNNKNNFHINSLKLDNDYLFIEGRIKNNHIRNTIYFADNYKIIISEDDTFEVSFEVHEAKLNPTQKCTYLKAVNYGLPKNVHYGEKKYAPRGIIIITIEKNYCIENIKQLVTHLIDNILK